MHNSALQTAKSFFQTYCSDRENIKVVDIGSQDVNGSMRSVITSNITEYIGLDFVEGKGVDIVLEDAYKYPLEDNSVDVIVTSSCFEHSEMFWLSFLESLRILKDDGLFYCNVPSSWMMYHRFPVDCWRFYPDAAKGLETWARYNKIDSMVLESYVVTPSFVDEFVSDYVFVMLKDKKHVEKYQSRMIDSLEDYDQFINGFRFPKNERFPNGWDSPKAVALQDILVPYSDIVTIDKNRLHPCQDGMLGFQ